MKVFVIDDHYIVRQGLADLLGSEGIKVIGSAKNADEACEHAFTDPPDILIVDLNLSTEVSGIDLIKQLVQLKPDTKIIVYSMRESLVAISAAYKAGALAYVTKASDPEILLEALRVVETGQLYFMPGFAEKLATNMFKGDAVDPKDILNEYEFPIFLSMAQGNSIKKISDETGLSARHITNRLVEIRKKLGCTNSAEFSRIALRSGHIDIDS